MSGTSEDVLTVARQEIGYSRFTDPETGSKYGRWYAALTKSPYFAANGVPYCAMFVSWVFAQAGATAAGLPGAYCPTMLQTAKAKGTTVTKLNAQPGDIVYFDFTGSGVTGHVGIVERNTGTYLVTIEGNTTSGTTGAQANGGVVARRTRAYSTVAGIVRPAWTTHTPATPVNGSQSGEQLQVDGVLGRRSISALQRRLGTPVDGVISGQIYGWRNRHAALTAVTYEGEGSLAIAALQAKLAVNTDGILGPASITAWQRHLVVAADGYLGPVTARAIQKALNRGGVW